MDENEPKPTESIDGCENSPTGTPLVSEVDNSQDARAKLVAHRRLWIGLSLIGVVLPVTFFIIWRLSLFKKMGSYGPIAIPSLIALGQILFKDWHNYKPKWIRWFLLSLVTASFIWGSIYQNEQIRDKAIATAKASQENAEATARTEAAQQAQSSNTKLFLDSLHGLEQELSTLQTSESTKQLQSELATVKASLESTRTALAPPPKISIGFTFVPFLNPPNPGKLVPSKEIRLPLDPGGFVHVIFVIYNGSDMAALDGETTLVICGQCRFAKEPEGFRKLAGQPDTNRIYSFQRILPYTALADMSADVIVPRSIESVAFGTITRCTNCVAATVPTVGIIHVIRDSLSP
jgi:hypothetical protein